MGQAGDVGGAGARPPRAETDESLRRERGRADARALADVEAKADEVVRVARELADDVVHVAREQADRARPAGSSAQEAQTDRLRVRADAALDVERTSADAALEAERTTRRLYLAAFLASEREATDQHLSGERAEADLALAARDRFLGNASHDLRALLATLALNATRQGRQAPEGPAGESIRASAVTNERLIVRMNRLVSDLLDVVSIEAGRLALDREPVDVEQLLRETHQSFAPIAEARGLTLVSEEVAGPVIALVDGGRVLQILANLVSNAIKFTSPPGRITTRLTIAREELVLSVADTGIGIAPQELTGVFERFRQVGRDRRGLGLGLHISRSLVEAHGGRLWVESTLGRGSTFFVALPRGGA